MSDTVNIPHIVIDVESRQAVMDVVQIGHNQSGLPFIDVLVPIRLVSGQLVYLKDQDKKPITVRVEGNFVFIPVRGQGDNQ